MVIDRYRKATGNGRLTYQKYTQDTLRMNANEARKITLANKIKTSRLSEIFAEITNAANEGKSGIVWFGDLSLFEKTTLASEGYKVNYNSNPDPGHPCNRSYYDISW